MTFFRQARVFIITGKGGVGKTTLSGVMANLAAAHGLRSLVVSLGTPGARRQLEVAHLARLFGREHGLDYEQVLLFPPSPLSPSPEASVGEVWARALRPDTALVEYLHFHGMRRLSRRLASSGALDVVATAVPGMPDILVLGKIKQMERTARSGEPDAPDVIFLDAPAAGHAVRFLQSPHGLLDAAGGGPVRAQAEEVVDMLTDASRCQVLLVCTPEETPVTETVETASVLEDRAGVKLCAVVVNARLPRLVLPVGTDLGTAVPQSAAEIASLATAAGVALSSGEQDSLAAAARARAVRQASEAVQVARLASELPLPQLELPYCFSTELGPEQLQALTKALESSMVGWAPVAA